MSAAVSKPSRIEAGGEDKALEVVIFHLQELVHRGFRNNVKETFLLPSEFILENIQTRNVSSSLWEDQLTKIVCDGTMIPSSEDVEYRRFWTRAIQCKRQWEV